MSKLKILKLQQTSSQERVKDQKQAYESVIRALRTAKAKDSDDDRQTEKAPARFITPNLFEETRRAFDSPSDSDDELDSRPV